MQSSFDRALAAVLKHEGGYVNNANDNGGPTNRGITLANFRKFVKPGGTIADLKVLTAAQASVVYQRQFWDAVLGSRLPAGVDYAVFDFAVNSGPSRAAKFLQRVVDVKQDGKIGPLTLAAVATKPAAEIVTELCDARLAWLQKLADWKHFGKGWASRVKGVRSLALTLAAEPSTEAPLEAPATPVPPAPETPATPKPVGEGEGFELDWGKVGLAVAIIAGAIAALAFIF